MQDKCKGSRNSAQNQSIQAPSNNHNPVLLTREAVAARWSVSVRTVDRLRQDGYLPWADLRCGRGAKPVVRFLLSDVEQYEQKARMNPRGTAT